MEKLWNKIVSELPLFEGEVKLFLEEINLHPINMKIDHLGLKFDSQSDVDELITSLEEQNSRLISSVEMKSRRFRIFELSQPIIFLDQEVSFIELPDAKKNVKRKRNGFEHIEFFFEEDIFTLEDLEDRFKERFPSFNCQYNLNLPHVEGQIPNPTLEIEKEGSEMEIKFHAKHIAEIVGRRELL
jgi:predicted metalloenzyme YecM